MNTPSTLPLEPILFPRLRIHFADFPYLRCPIGQRLLTSETCCGYQYGQMRRLAFMKRALASSGFSRADKSVPDTTENRGAQPAFQPFLWANQFQGVEDPTRLHESLRTPENEQSFLAVEEGRKPSLRLPSTSPDSSTLPCATCTMVWGY